MRLADKVAIISGAASGMGAATARMFAREGAKVVIADVLEHESRQVADAIGASARFEPRAGLHHRCDSLKFRPRHDGAGVAKTAVRRVRC